MCSKHVQAWNKLIIKFSASGWFILRNELNRTFYSLLKQEVVAAPITSTFTFFFTLLQEDFIRNIIIILRINYFIIVITCMNNNSAVISNNVGMLQHLIFLLFKIPMGTRKNFLKICGHFGHAPSIRFASPVLVCHYCGLCRLQLKRDGTQWRMGGEVKGKLANGVGGQYPSHYLGTWCIQHYYRWCAHLVCQ